MDGRSWLCAALLLGVLVTPEEVAQRTQGSPVTQQLAFVTERDGTSQISIMNADGHNQTLLTDSKRNAVAPVWTPDGRRLAFVLDDETGIPTVNVMNADGTGKVRISGSGFAHMPSWSPDGRRIAFMSSSEGALQIVVADADGNREQRLTSITGEHGSPAWSPDGMRIAFVARRDTSGPQVYVVNTDGSSEIRLSQRGVLLRRGFMEAVWSPDSRRLLFVSVDDHENIVIYSSAIDGREPRVLAQGYAPTWSPDGQKIAFACCFLGPEIQVYIMNADGSNRKVLTKWPSGSTFPPWSPDGTSISFVCCFPGAMNVYVMNADGRGSRRVAVAATTMGPGGGLGPLIAWRPLIR